jgi:tetratricopeptide (TPR) repeat protein
VTRIVSASLLVCAMGLRLLAQAPVSAPSSGSRVLVVPFDNVTRDARIFWLGEASAVLLADDLNALGADAITREERQEAFDRLQVPRSAALTEATVIRIGQIVGAAQVVVGTLELDGDVLVVHATSIALDVGRIQNSLAERGPVSDLSAMFERLAHALVPSSNAASDHAPLDHPLVGAFEDYVKGLLADVPATAINYLNAALQVQPTFDRARLALWDVYEQEGDHERALAAVLPVAAESPWSRRGRFLAGLSQVNLKRYDEAFATFRALADRSPSAPVLNNLGVVQLRRGSTTQEGRATYFFNKAAEADATDADYFFNLGYAYWAERDTQAAIYWLREAVRRDPADGAAHFILGAALSASGNTAEANREKELARRLSSTYAEWEKRPGPDVVPKGLERLKGDVELPHARGIEETLATGGQRSQRELARFYLDRGRRLYQQENDSDALADLGRVLYLSPYEAEAHLLVGRIHLRAGRIREAIDAFKISLWSAETADAHAALAAASLAAKDSATARAEAQRALALDPSSAEARQVLDRIPK